MLISKLSSEIETFETKIAEISASRNISFIKSNFMNLSENGLYSVHKMWKCKQKVDAKQSNIPSAKYDSNGQLITTKAGILTLFEEEYTRRLSKDPPHQGFEELQVLKDYLFKLRLKISSKEKSQKIGL